MDAVTRAGADRVIINVHHHEDKIRAYLADHSPAGTEVVLSPEPGGPYETGGGLYAAAPLFRETGPFLLHNVDVLSAIPLPAMIAEHEAGKHRSRPKLVATFHDGFVSTHPIGDPTRQGTVVASLAVQDREASRRLLFDDRGLMGWENRGSDRAPPGTYRVREPVGPLRRWAFTGIHVVEPDIFGLSQRTGTFSIITLYLELAAEGYIVLPLDVSRHPWIDVGTPERLEEAERVAGTWE
jgi:NDP-sugar pyrophosphorylase family protein